MMNFLVVNKRFIDKTRNIFSYKAEHSGLRLLIDKNKFVPDPTNYILFAEK